MVPSLETTMSERTRELTEAELDDVSGGFWLLDLLRFDMEHYYEGDVPDLSEVLSGSPRNNQRGNGERRRDSPDSHVEPSPAPPLPAGPLLVRAWRWDAGD